MRVVIQRVSKASVTIDHKTKSKIGLGLVILLGIEENDSFEDVKWLSTKIARLRIFNDHNGLMNLPLTEMDGDIIVVSQFTLHANIKKGNRPSFTRAAKPEKAIPLYEAFIAQLEIDVNKKVQTGIFGADMKVELVNDGPVTIIMDSKNRE